MKKACEEAGKNTEHTVHAVGPASSIEQYSNATTTKATVRGRPKGGGEGRKGRSQGAVTLTSLNFSLERLDLFYGLP